MRSYSLGLYEKSMPTEITWSERFKIAKKYAYDFVEISIDETDDRLARLEMSYKDRLEFIKTMYDEGVYIQSMCLSGHRKYPLGSLDEKISQRGMEIMEKSLEFAQHLGIRIIQLAGYDVYYENGNEKTAEKFAENLRKSCDLAAKYCVVMGFETMETEFMNTVSKAMKYVDMMKSPYLAVYPDIGNITNAAKTYGTDVLEDLKSGEGNLVALHLKESVPGKFREIPFGTGHVDFNSAVDTAWKLGVRRYVTELWKTDDNWEKSIEHASAMMRGILDKQI